MTDGTVESMQVLPRQKFRDFFQPSRVLLAVIPEPETNRYNVITVCFSMYCSYKPNMMAFAVQNGSYSFDIIPFAKQCVLSVPGESMAETAMNCGTLSGRDLDKFSQLSIRTVASRTVSPPSLKDAIANIEISSLQTVQTGNHCIVFGEVANFVSMTSNSHERPLLSVGKDTRGYTVLLQKGIHRLAVVNRSN